MKKYVLALFASAAVVSCGSLAPGVKTVNQPSLENTRWQLAENVKGKIPTLVVESSRISGNAGCNNYFGEITIDSASGNFSARNLGSTKMMCDNMDTESNFLTMLPKATKYRVSGNSLELYQNNLLLLKFNRLQ